MRQVFLEEAPKKGKLINWRKTKGMKFDFTYDDIEGELNVVDVYRRNKRTFLLIEYQGRIKEYTTTEIQQGSLGELVGRHTSEHLFSVGEIVTTKRGGLRILRQTRDKKRVGTEKSYDYICLNCNSEGHKTEGALKAKQGCSFCGGRSHRVNKDVNSISKTHPHLLKNFVNTKDAETHSFKSHKKVLVKCSHCNATEIMPIRKLTTKNGYECACCYFRTPYPESFVANFLTQLGFRFQTQYRPTWAKNKRYDFYLPDHNMIIETHGAQHYENTRRRPKWKSYEEEHENDLLKFDLSVINGVEHYVVLDCRKSELEWIKGNIMKSKLSKLLNFKEEDIDWNKCDIDSFDNRMVIANKMYMDGYSVDEIANALKTTSNTCRKWLTRGEKLGISDYDPRKSCSKPVLCMETGKIYKSQKECEREMTKEFGIQFNNASISSVCRGATKQHNGYTFKWI